MELIDFHCHIYPDAVAEKAAQSIRDFYEIGGGNLAGTVNNLLTYGKAAGISRYVVLPVSLKPERTQQKRRKIYESYRHCQKSGRFGKNRHS